MALDDAALIDELATPHRAGPAYKALMARGPAATAAIVGGLRHD